MSQASQLRPDFTSDHEGERFVSSLLRSWQRSDSWWEASELQMRMGLVTRSQQLTSTSPNLPKSAEGARRSETLAKAKTHTRGWCEQEAVGS